MDTALEAVGKTGTAPDPYLKIYIGKDMEEIYDGRKDHLTNANNPTFVSIKLTRNDVLAKLGKGSLITRRGLRHRDNLQFYIAIFDFDALNKDDAIGHVVTTLGALKKKGLECMHDKEKGFFDKIVSDCKKDMHDARLQVRTCQPFGVIYSGAARAISTAELRAAEAEKARQHAEAVAVAAETAYKESEAARKHVEAENERLKALIDKIHEMTDL